MSTFTDLEKDAASVDGFVNDNALVVTRRNGPKPSWQYLVDGWNGDIEKTISDLYDSRGFNQKGTFSEGFTYEIPNDVGIDSSGEAWVYNGSLPHTVSAGTTPSSPTYTKVFYSDHNSTVNRDDYGSHSSVSLKQVTTNNLMNIGFVGLPVGAVVETFGFSTLGDGGGAKWVLTSVTGVASQTPAELGDAKFTDSEGRVWELSRGGEINIKSLGAVGDGSSDDSDIIIAAANAWVSTDVSLLFPEGKYLLSKTVTCDFQGGRNKHISMEGGVVTTSSLVTAVEFINVEDLSGTLRVLGGGTTGDLSQAATSSGGTECFVFRGTRNVNMEIYSFGYLGRVIRTKRQESGEYPTKQFNFKCVSGNRVGTGLERTGQIIYADDGGVGSAQGAWGSFSWRGEGNHYGPVWEDLNDITIGELEAGEFLKQGIEFRGCRVISIDKIYPGDAWIAAGGVDADAISFIPSATGTGRKCSNLMINTVRGLTSRNCIYASDFDSTKSGILISKIVASQISESILLIENVAGVEVSCITGDATVEKAVTLSSCKDVDITFKNTDIGGTALVVDAACTDVYVHGKISGGRSTSPLVEYYGSGHLTFSDYALESDAASELVYIDSAGTTNLRMLNGRRFVSGSTVEFNSSRVPRLDTTQIEMQNNIVSLSYDGSLTPDNSVTLVNNTGDDSTINNNFSDISNKLNAIIAALENYKVLRT